MDPPPWNPLGRLDHHIIRPNQIRFGRNRAPEGEKNEKMRQKSQREREKKRGKCDLRLEQKKSYIFIREQDKLDMKWIEVLKKFNAGKERVCYIYNIYYCAVSHDHRRIPSKACTLRRGVRRNRMMWLVACRRNKCKQWTERFWRTVLWVASGGFWRDVLFIFLISSPLL